MLNLTVFSQTVTDTNYIRIPTPIARQIALDLVDGDRYKEELIITQNMFYSSVYSSYIKDTIIDNFVFKTQLYKKQIDLYKEKEIEYIKNNNTLKYQLKKSRLTKNIALIGLIISISLSYTFNLNN